VSQNNVIFEYQGTITSATRTNVREVDPPFQILLYNEENEEERNLDRIIHQSAGQRETTGKQLREPDVASTDNIVTEPLDAQDQDVEINDQESADGSSQTDLAHKESTVFGRELTRSQNVHTVEQVGGSATAVPMEESEILPDATIERDNVTRLQVRKLPTPRKPLVVVLNFSSRPLSSQTQGLMSHAEYGQARRPEHTFRWHHQFCFHG
jgi:hypothetical protein